MKKILFALSFAITLSTLTYSLQAVPYSGGAWKKDSVGWSYGYDEGFYLSNCWFTDNVIGTISTVRDILLQINGLSFSIMKVSIGIILQVTVKWSPING